MSEKRDPPLPWGSSGFGSSGAAAEHLRRRDLLGERIRSDLAGIPVGVHQDVEADTRPGIPRPPQR